MEFGVDWLSWLEQSANCIRSFILFITIGFPAHLCHPSEQCFLLVTRESLKVPCSTLSANTGMNFKERFPISILECISSAPLLLQGNISLSLFLFFFSGPLCGMWKSPGARSQIRAAVEVYCTAMATQDLSCIFNLCHSLQPH